MSRASPPSLRATAGAGAVAAACALGAGVLLASLAAPPDFKARVGALETKARSAETLLRRSQITPPYPADALCHRPAAQQAQVVRSDLTTLAAQTNLSLEGVDTHLEGPPDAANAPAPIRLRFSATGSYENVVLLLQALSRQRPEFFVDTADLTAKTANVTLTFSGRLFCAA